MDIPQGLKYSKGHQWARIDGKTATIGITSFAVKQLKDIVFVELPKKGRLVKAGEIVSSIESIKSVSDVPSPVAGTVIEVNERLAASPDILNKDCYSEGWIAKINVSEPASLMSAEEYKKLLGI